MLCIVFLLFYYLFFVLQQRPWKHVMQAIKDIFCTRRIIVLHPIIVFQKCHKQKNEKVNDIMCPRAYSMLTLHMVSMPLRIIGKLKF